MDAGQAKKHRIKQQKKMEAEDKAKRKLAMIAEVGKRNGLPPLEFGRQVQIMKVPAGNNPVVRQYRADEKKALRAAERANWECNKPKVKEVAK